MLRIGPSPQTKISRARGDVRNIPAATFDTAFDGGAAKTKIPARNFPRAPLRRIACRPSIARASTLGATHFAARRFGRCQFRFGRENRRTEASRAVAEKATVDRRPHRRHSISHPPHPSPLDHPTHAQCTHTAPVGTRAGTAEPRSTEPLAAWHWHWAQAPALAVSRWGRGRRPGARGGRARGGGGPPRSRRRRGGGGDARALSARAAARERSQCV